MGLVRRRRRALDVVLANDHVCRRRIHRNLKVDLLIQTEIRHGEQRSGRSVDANHYSYKAGWQRKARRTYRALYREARAEDGADRTLGRHAHLEAGGIRYHDIS